MLIDFHTHVFPDKIARRTIEHLSEKGGIPPYSDGSVSGLLARMEEAKADLAVTLPVLTNPEKFDSVNRFAAEVNEAYGTGTHRLCSFAGIHPACEDIEGKMKEIKERGFLGVKIHPDYQETFITDPGYVRILECAKEYDLIVVTHAGVDGGYKGCPVRCTPALARELIRKVPHAKLVLAHCGANEMPDEVCDTLAGENVYFDTAYVLRFIGKERFERLLERHGDDRILFASDSPWSSIRNDAEILRSFGLPKATEEKILSLNAKRLLGLSE